MRDDELDRILSRDAEIVPSSGFVGSVMHAIDQQSAAPPSLSPSPIPFPWLRAFPLVVSAALLMVLLAFLIAGALASLAGQAPSGIGFDASAYSASQLSAGWVMLALAVSAVSALLPIRLLGGKA